MLSRSTQLQTNQYLSSEIFFVEFWLLFLVLTWFAKITEDFEGIFGGISIYVSNLFSEEER